MSDSLVIAGYAADGLPTLTINTTSGVFLAPDFSFGDLVLSGSLLDRYADREITLPLVVKNTTRAVMRSSVEGLLQAVSREFFTLTWTPDGGLPIVFDCYAAQVGQSWDMILDNQAVRAVSVTMLARPYGRTPTTTEAVTGSASSGSRWAALAPTGVKGSAPGLVTDVEISGTDLRSLLFYVSPEARFANAPIALAAVGGAGVSFTANGVSVFDQTGTMALWVSASSVPATGTAVQIRLDLTEAVGGVNVSGVGIEYPLVVTQEMLQSRYIPLGMLPLPLGGSLGGTRTYNVEITSTGPTGTATNQIVPQDLLLLNTQGTTVYSSGSGSCVKVYITPPTPEIDTNLVYVSNSTRAASNTDALLSTVSQGPLKVYPSSGVSGFPAGVMLVHTNRTTSPSFVAKYAPRWLSERTV